MRSLVIITKKIENGSSQGFFSEVHGKNGGGHKGVRCGLRPYEAAAAAARYAMEYVSTNPEGGDIMAPPEVLELIPEHLRSIPAKIA